MAMQLAIYAPRDGTSFYAVMKEGIMTVKYMANGTFQETYTNTTVIHFSHWFSTTDPEVRLPLREFNAKYSSFGVQSW